MANKHVIQKSEFKHAHPVKKGMSLDNGVLGKSTKEHKLGSFADIVADGYNSEGLMVQTPNGTSRQDHRQIGRAWNLNTDRWTKNDDWDGDMSGL